MSPPSPDFEQLFEALPSPYMVLDRDLRYVGANRAYREVTGRTSAELIGSGLFDAFPNEGPAGERLRESLERVIATGKPDTLAFLPYPIDRNEGEPPCMRYWTVVHTPLFDTDGSVAFIVQNTVDVTELAPAGAMDATRINDNSQTRVANLFQRAREAEHAKQSLINESREFRRLFENAPSIIAVLHGADHVCTFANRAAFDFIQRSDIIGMPLRRFSPTTEGQGLRGEMDRVFASGQPWFSRGVPIRLRHCDEDGFDIRYLDVACLPIFDDGEGNGRPVGLFIEAADVTSTVRALRQKELLLAELNHRVKNTLATIQSIARQSFRPGQNMVRARADFESRLMAISHIHDLLAQSDWESAPLHDLVAGVLRSADPGSLHISGSNMLLQPRAALALGMILQELLVNAIRHGALSVARGRVDIDWRTAGDGDDAQLILQWRERNGPHVHPPATRGFGYRLIERSVPAELRGRLVMDHAPEGFGCILEMPLRIVNADGDHG